jgi:hypothetical protein
MAKKKLSLGEGGIKGFLANHVEKILFALILGAAAMLVWSGFSKREGIVATKTPVKLKDEVTRATSHVTGFSWNKDYRESRSPKEANTLLPRAAQTLVKMNEDSYIMPQMIAPPVSAPRTKRTDPDLLAVVELKARTGYGALVKPSINRARTGETDEEEEVFVDEEETLDLDPDRFRQVPNGYGVGGGGGGGRRGSSNADAGEGVYFVTVTGLIPYREQLKIFQSSFLNASAFSPNRDAPNYIYWQLERSVVKPGSKERKWTKISSTKAKNEEARLGVGGGSGRQFGSVGDVDPRSIDPMLTRPGPPLIARNLDQLYRHEKIMTFEEAMEQIRAEEEAAAAETVDSAVAGADEEGIDIDVNAVSPATGGGRNPGRGGYGGDESGGRGYGGDEFADGGYGGDEEGGGGGRYPGGARQAGVTSTEGGATDPSKAPEFKMFRYVDLNVRSGETYVYRLKVYLEDPNFPITETAEPPESSLEGSVIQRRKAKKAKVAAGISRPKIANRATEFSDESNPITIQAGNRMLAGAVKPARATRGKDMAFYRPGDEPTGTAMALTFDIQRAAEIPGQLEVRRGTVANFVVDETEVLRPSLNLLEKLEDHEFRLNSFVLDLRGGRKHSKYDELNEPGEFLVIDSRGRISVINELTDMEDFKSNIFPEEAEATNSGPGARGEGGGYGDEDGGPPNFGGGL